MFDLYYNRPVKSQTDTALDVPLKKAYEQYRDEGIENHARRDERRTF